MIADHQICSIRIQIVQSFNVPLYMKKYFQKEIICDDKTSGNPVRNFAPKVTPSRERNYEFYRSAQTDECSVNEVLRMNKKTIIGIRIELVKS